MTTLSSRDFSSSLRMQIARNRLADDGRPDADSGRLSAALAGACGSTLGSDSATRDISAANEDEDVLVGIGIGGGWPAAQRRRSSRRNPARALASRAQRRRAATRRGHPRHCNLKRRRPKPTGRVNVGTGGNQDGITAADPPRGSMQRLPSNESRAAIGAYAASGLPMHAAPNCRVRRRQCNSVAPRSSANQIIPSRRGQRVQIFFASPDSASASCAGVAHLCKVRLARRLEQQAQYWHFCNAAQCSSCIVKLVARMSLPQFSQRRKTSGGGGGGGGGGVDGAGAGAEDVDGWSRSKYPRGVGRFGGLPRKEGGMW